MLKKTYTVPRNLCTNNYKQWKYFKQEATGTTVYLGKTVNLKTMDSYKTKVLDIPERDTLFVTVYFPKENAMQNFKPAWFTINLKPLKEVFS